MKLIQLMLRVYLLIKSDKKIIFFKQPNQMDCGMTCIRMITTTYGKKVSLSYLYKIVSATNSGTNLFVLKTAAEKIGFEATPMQMELENLHTIPLPAILHWNKNHFVVLYNIKKKKGSCMYTIADPASGIVSYSKQEMKNQWISNKKDNTGLILILNPSKEFSKETPENDRGNDSSKWLVILNYLKTEKKKLIIIFALLLIGNLLVMLLPKLTQILFDNGIKKKQIDLVYLIVLGQFIVMVGKFFIDFFYQRVLLFLSIRINKNVLSDFILKLTRLPIKFYENKSIGDIMQRIDDQYKIEHFLTGNSVNVLLSVILFLFYSFLLISYSPIYFYITIGFTSAYVLWIKYILVKRKLLNQTQFGLSGANQNHVIEMIQSMQETKLNGNINYNFGEWQKSQNQIFGLQEKFLQLQLREQLGTFALNDVCNLLITLLASLAVINNNSSIGTMIAVQFILGQINGPVEQFIYLINDWQDAHLALERMTEINDIEDEDPERLENEIVKVPHVIDDIVMTNVNFTYQGGIKPVLNNINITLKKNTITAIVGTSGSGKTTLLKLLLKYYLPDVGTISIGNHDLHAFSHEEWRSRCGTVMQDGYIYNDTIARNIATSDLIPDIEKLIEVCKLAAVDSFIKNFPNGYDTIIGEHGINLSKGQKQRLLIARALYKNPTVLIFDEATNSLDSTNEKNISNNLKAFYQGKTVIIVAHRLSTIMHADKIIVLEKGKIIEQGNHKELIVNKGRYFELIKDQLSLGQ
jgi:ATP-binding cassette, subfamily B, bacterial